MNYIREIIFLVIILVLLNGCARNGEFSTEGAYEALKSIDRSDNPSIGNEDQKYMTYREYERLRKENTEQRGNQ